MNDDLQHNITQVWLLNGEKSGDAITGLLTNLLKYSPLISITNYAICENARGD